VAPGHRAERAERLSAGGDVAAGGGQGGRAGGEQHAPPGGAAMLHARHDFLPDITALLETDAAALVEQHVMRKSVAQCVVAATLGYAMGDAEGVPRGYIPTPDFSLQGGG